MRTLSLEEQEFFDAIELCDGFEVHRDDWPLAEQLVEAGCITLGAARGPRGDFRRAELTGGWREHGKD